MLQNMERFFEKKEHVFYFIFEPLPVRLLFFIRVSMSQNNVELEHNFDDLVIVPVAL